MIASLRTSAADAAAAAWQHGNTHGYLESTVEARVAECYSGWGLGNILISWLRGFVSSLIDLRKDCKLVKLFGGHIYFID